MGPAADRGPEEIRGWLIAAIADAADLDPAEIDPSRSFHDFGLSSTQAVALSGEFEDWLCQPLAPTLLYEHPTIDALVAALGGEPGADGSPQEVRVQERAAEPLPGDAPLPDDDDAVCIVGVGCRFPGGGDGPEQFWQSLLAGKGAERDVPPDRWDAAAHFDPDPAVPGKAYTTRGGFLDDVAGFDAGFFGISPAEALRMDPQQRLLLEVSWAALEDAGIAADRLRGSRTGVFVGMMSSQEYGRLELDSDGDLCLDDPYFGYGTAPSVAAGRLSYAMDLRGPSMCVDTACSSSLLGVHLAAESLRRGECELALAGGVSALVHPAAMIQACAAHMLARDGRCKPFDERADGFLMAEGCGFVVLERLGDALARGHRVLGLLRGSAVNQDGRSNGMTAPSPEAQAGVIRRALAAAGVEPGEVGYVEAHGSGTRLGDAIELSALQEVFHDGRDPSSPLLIGAVKGNVGHLLGAAGVAGLIKALHVLRDGRVPPNRHFDEPSSAIDWSRAPVVVPGKTVALEGPGSGLAGVSSFGWSGTNVHVVLERWAPERASANDGRAQLVPVSARTETALQGAAAGLAEHLEALPAPAFADAAYTLQAGRAALEHRAAYVCESPADAAAALRDLAGGGAGAQVRPGTSLRPVFLFPGTGDQYPGMGADLYAGEPACRAALDACADAAAPLLGADLREVLYAGGERGRPAAEASLAARLGRGACATPPDADDPLGRTDVAHCAVFAIEYALARLLQSWGIEPAGMVGYSLGEYVAACMAGVFAPEDGVRLVARRAQLISDLGDGAMVAVAAAAPELEDLLAGGVSVAAINGPAMTVLSGAAERVATVEGELDNRGLAHQRIRTRHALHSSVLERIRADVEALVAGVGPREPSIPFVSSSTGTWIEAGQAREPAYWAQQMIAPVRFDKAIAEVARMPGAALLEVGPGQTLASLARQALIGAETRDTVVAATLPVGMAAGRGGDREQVLRAVAAYWTGGGAVDWERLHESGGRRIGQLPTYSFEHQRFWPDGRRAPVCAPAEAEPQGNLPDLGDWGYAPVWRQSLLATAPVDSPPRWLVFCDGSELSEAIGRGLRDRAADVVTVRPGEGFDSSAPDVYTIDPARTDDHEQLLAHLDSAGRFPERVLHGWSLTPNHEAGQAAMDRSFLSLLAAVRAVGRRAAGRSVGVVALSTGVHDVLGDEDTEPMKATLLGLCRTTEQEFSTIRCRNVDVAPSATAGLAARLLEEIHADPPDPSVAYRGAHRWVQTWEATRLDAVETGRVWRENGAYLITGGLGGLGLALARRLARRPVRLALLGRTALPPRERWDDEALMADAATRRRVEAIRELEALGAEVLPLAGDVAEPAQVAVAVAQARERFGTIHGVVHAAGVPAGGLIQLKTRQDAETVLRPKVAGALALQEALGDEPLDFFVLYSSAVVAHGGLGESDYCAANCFLDAFAHRARRRGAPVTAIDWGPWQWDSWTEDRLNGAGSRLRDLRREHGITDEEGVELLTRILGGDHPQVLVAQQDPARLAARWAELTSQLVAPVEPGRAYPRPALRTPYAAPRTDLERTISAVWQRYLGLDRVGVDDQFFELGGTSLIGLTIVGELEREVGTALSAADLLAAPTPGALAALIGARGDVSTREPQADGRGEQRRRRAAAAAARRGERAGQGAR
jgi:acyl transferase domain-containing protein/acyl carrier protein